MKQHIIVQGDVLLRPYAGAVPVTASVPADPRYAGLVLAEGEETGYAHFVQGPARLIEATASSPRLLVIDANDALDAAQAILRHALSGAVEAPAKHPSQPLQPGVYEVTLQVEERVGRVTD